MLGGDEGGSLGRGRKGSTGSGGLQADERSSGRGRVHVTSGFGQGRRNVRWNFGRRAFEVEGQIAKMPGKEDGNDGVA